MVEKVSAFFVGNVVGLTILVGGVLLTAPKKLKETEIIQKQEEARKAQAAQAQKDSAAPKDSVAPKDSAAAIDPASTEKPAQGKNPMDHKDSTAATNSNQFGSYSKKNLAPYVVSTMNIARGEKIDVSAVKLVELPTKDNQDALSNVESVVGKTAIVDIHTGNTITAKALKN